RFGLRLSHGRRSSFQARFPSRARLGKQGRRPPALRQPKICSLRFPPLIYRPSAFFLRLTSACETFPDLTNAAMHAFVSLSPCLRIQFSRPLVSSPSMAKFPVIIFTVF